MKKAEFKAGGLFEDLTLSDNEMLMQHGESSDSCCGRVCGNSRCYRMFICLFLLFLSLNSQAISIVGRALDAENKQPLEAANIVLALTDSTAIAQSLTLKDGSFTVNAPEVGDYLLFVTHLGYQPTTVAVRNIREKLDLGVIELSASSVTLDEVVVSAKDYTRVDRQIIFPTLQTITNSFTGLDVISKLMLPGILVNAADNSIASITNRPVQLRINGVPVTMDEALVVNPRRIIKIEYIDMPGVRYGDAGAVINFVLKKAENGFSTGGNLRNGLNALYSNDMLNFKYNYKLSELGITYNLLYSDFPDSYTDERQTLQFPDSRLELIKKGIKAPNRTQNHNLNLSYNWNNNENAFFNIIFRNSISRPDNSTAQLVDDGLNNIKYTSSLKTKERSYSPALDMYFQYSPDERQTFMANAVVTHIASDYQRNYKEFLENNRLKNDFSYDVSGKKYSILSEIIYENKLNKTMTFASGFKYSQAGIENTYSQDNGQTVNTMNTSEIQAYAQLQGVLNTFVYQLEGGYSRQTFNESEGKYVKNSFRPSMTLSYSPKDNMTLRYNLYIMPSLMPLSYLSGFKQRQNEYEVFVGSPNLKPFNVYGNTLTFNYRKGRISVMPNLYFQYNPDYAMNSISRIEENGKYHFEYTNSNQKGYRHLQGLVYVTAELVKNRLSATVVEGFNRYFNFGDNYTHCYTGHYQRFQLEGNYKSWSLSASLTLASEMLSGETLVTFPTSANTVLRYRYKNFQYGLEIINPFLPDGTPNKQELISKYVQKETTAYNRNYGNFVRFTVAWNLDYGRKYSGKQKQIYQSDEESGVVK